MGASRVRPFRLGVQRATTGEFKPLATVGVAGDGGLWVAPHAVRDFGWVYGATTTDGPAADQHVQVEKRPKLHYHRSGIVRVTLTGEKLPLREERYQPINRIKRAQILSVVSVRPWELPSAQPRPGDVASIDLQWPSRVAFTVAVITPRRRRTHAAQTMPGSAVGMLGSDDHHFTIDASSHGIRALYICDITRSFEAFDQDVLPGTTVMAFPVSAGSSAWNKVAAFALWTDSMRNPIGSLVEKSEIRSRRSLSRSGPWTVREVSLESKAAYLRSLSE